eukprot:TRINITY_DN4855_c0_g1_i1.p1 TRINITY_DN4855_c0_g1~~TRINITY_DN4855_c0_g1_i1.p1  ORF type:complete len:664 (-),score=127.46 TRINITY_DN4855_c0_g1_i1:21-1985(-)
MPGLPTWMPPTPTSEIEAELSMRPGRLQASSPPSKLSGDTDNVYGESHSGSPADVEGRPSPLSDDFEEPVSDDSGAAFAGSCESTVASPPAEPVTDPVPEAEAQAAPAIHEQKQLAEAGSEERLQQLPEGQHPDQMHAQQRPVQSGQQPGPVQSGQQPGPVQSGQQPGHGVPSAVAPNVAVPVFAPHVAPPRIHFGLSGDALELMLAPGDVLVVRGSGRLADIGAAGGFMGHVLVCVSAPRAVPQHSQEAHALASLWPKSATALWLVRTMESTRREAGLWECNSVVYICPSSRRLILVGEVELDGDVCAFDSQENVEIWQSPHELRVDLNVEVMGRILADMRKNQASWSATTAARAVLTSAKIPQKPDPLQTMEDVASCWDRAPICTSVVISFWQRYLQAIAALLCRREMPPPDPRSMPEKVFCSGEKVVYWSSSYQYWCDAVVKVLHHNSDGELHCYTLDVKQGALPGNVRRPPSAKKVAAKASALVLKHMPLKADRALPGELLKSMQAAGWICMLQVPMIFRQTIVPAPAPIPAPVYMPMQLQPSSSAAVLQPRASESVAEQPLPSGSVVAPQMQPSVQPSASARERSTSQYGAADQAKLDGYFLLPTESPCASMIEAPDSADEGPARRRSSSGLQSTDFEPAPRVQSRILL